LQLISSTARPFSENDILSRSTFFVSTNGKHMCAFFYDFFCPRPAVLPTFPFGPVLVSQKSRSAARF
jgi:hypothetical protein